MEHKIIEMEEFTVVGVKIDGKVENIKQNNPFPKLWEDFMGRANEIENKDGTQMYGVCLDDPEDKLSFEGLATVPVTSSETIPEGMVTRTIPKNKYASYTHTGKLDTLHETYDNIVEDIMKQGFKLKGVWLELYDERFKFGDDSSEMDILVAIE